MGCQDDTVSFVLFAPVHSTAMVEPQENLHGQTDVTFRNLLRMFLGLPKFESTSLLCAVLDVRCCQTVIRKLVHRFMSRMEGSKNGHLLCFPD